MNIISHLSGTHTGVFCCQYNTTFHELSIIPEYVRDSINCYYEIVEAKCYKKHPKIYMKNLKMLFRTKRYHDNTFEFNRTKR